jgi:tetrahydromethanopterin S-methyltransferase subunit A
VIRQGADEKKRIIGTNTPHPFLFNLSRKMIERFRKQLSVIDLQFEGDPNLIRKAVWPCYQENTGFYKPDFYKVVSETAEKVGSTMQDRCKCASLKLINARDLGVRHPQTGRKANGHVCFYVKRDFFCY